jgi:hypothetical protein
MALPPRCAVACAPATAEATAMSSKSLLENDRQSRPRQPAAEWIAGPAVQRESASLKVASRAKLPELEHSPRLIAQRHMIAAVFGPHAPQLAVAQRESAPPVRNDTGLSDQLKSGIESLSGVSLDHVKVHYNSAQPAEMNAYAYAQQNDIHLASGAERHLPHEAWHVVQQAQGRVKPTAQLKHGVPLNDDAGLEHEADVMGAKALQMRFSGSAPADAGIKAAMDDARPTLSSPNSSNSRHAVQRKIYYGGRWYGPDDKGALEQTKGLPEVRPGFLLPDEPFVLSADEKSWVKDVTLEFKGMGRGGYSEGNDKLLDTKKVTIARLDHPLEDVGLGERSKDRIGPKHLDRRVTKITIFKGALGPTAHWALQCEVTGGKKTKHMKVDLIESSYRILYGASQHNADKVEFTPKALPLLPSVGLVYWLFVKIAKEKGKWTGNKWYNCQDFALEMLSRIHVDEEERLEEQRQVRADFKDR